MDLEYDSDDSSPPETLDQFREKWKKELSGKKHPNRSTTGHNNPVTNEADAIFMEAVELERKGKVFEAMRMYRRAVHLDPEIEYKMYDKLKTTTHLVNSDSLQEDEQQHSDDNQNIEDLSSVDLVTRFRESIDNGNGLLFNKGPATVSRGVILTTQDAPSSNLHISSLPFEILMHILRWVVSSNLDLRSLEQCAMSCKGFYLCARDPEIWRLACIRVWGHAVGTLKCSKYASWRQMYVERPRVCFNGCYISRTNYIRYGERNFQDQFYRPVHIVDYYRYFRFFPDGKVIVMTTADEPAQVVGKLQNAKHRTDVMVGTFKFSNDIVTIIARRNKTKDYNHSERLRGFSDFESATATFCMQLVMSYTKTHRLPQLVWKKYSIMEKRDKGDDSSSDFELTPGGYPPLIFSRVKSYDSVSYHHL